MDENTLQNLYAQCFPNRNAENELNFIKNAGIKQILHKIDGKIAGFLFFKQISPDEIEIIDIGVGVDFRRQGIAHNLIKRLINITKDLGGEKLLLEVAEDNVAALNLYKRLDFIVDGTRKNYYKLGNTKINAILMSKKL